MAGGHPLDFEWTSLRQDTGERFPTKVRLRRLFAGDEPRVLAMVRDMTEERRVEQERRNIDRLRAVSLLAGGVAHDFNNLLAGILGNIQLARMLDDPRAVANALSEAEKAAERAAGLTRQLSVFARGEPLATETVALTDLVEETVRFSLRGSAVRVALDIDPRLWTAQARREQVGQVVQNLALNAVQALGSRGGTLHVKGENVRLEETSAAGLPPGDYVALTFRDDDPGIPPDLAERVLDPWFTTRPEGTGLGLAIAFSVARQHGGHLSVEPSTSGACLRILLPRGGEVTEAPRRQAAREGGGLRVLVMDDQELMHSLLKRSLRKLGHAVSCHAEGASAVSAFAEAMEQGEPFDFVLLDMIVPGGMGGAETRVALRELDATVPIVACTGHATESTAGFDATLAKPFTIDQLSEVLARLSRRC